MSTGLLAFFLNFVYIHVFAIIVFGAFSREVTAAKYKAMKMRGWRDWE